MRTAKNSLITIRVSDREKYKFRLLSTIEGRTVSEVVKGLVERELSTKKLTASEIRKLPKEERAFLLRQMTEEAMPVYNRYKDELFINETGDGIE